ncbi:GDP-mannose 4,6-dehydratase [Massilia endophytica]|uniref:GDP-mannose 4,6-dehydratase n=1 Tax=Massilia endophytica TaxID=2899220 RepID=UPI001E4CD53C|nr:GDP-mannose 4,6-dehydratase [Massilia endophytica]UGQ46595.1 GDP-mannose 4,6-dehydratase [Massilia endophytica]
MQHRFLVIGSNSFSGAAFVAYLLERGHSVIGVSRSEEPHPVMLPYKWREPKGSFAFHQVDLNRNLPDLIALMNEQQPEYAVNFAAQGMVAQSWLQPAHWYQTNVVSQVLLHDEMRKLRYLKKYVHVTTPEVYGSTDGWHAESFHFAPSTPYAVSRAACDLHLMSFFKAYSFPVCFTRAANVYGPGQQLYRIMPRAMLYARLGKQMELHGGGHSVRSFIHIDDVADATLRIADHGVPGESYHISTWETVSIRQLVERVCDMTGVAFADLVKVTEDRLGKDQAYLLDSNKIRKELGWADTINLDTGMQQTLAWVDNNLDTLKTLPADYIHKA